MESYFLVDIGRCNSTYPKCQIRTDRVSFSRRYLFGLLIFLYQRDYTDYTVDFAIREICEILLITNK